MDSAQRHPGTIAQMSRMYSCLFCDWQRDRYLDDNRDIRSDGAATTECGLDLIFPSEPGPPLHREWQKVRSSKTFMGPRRLKPSQKTESYRSA